MRVKVYNGSVEHSGSNLCDTCRHSTVIRGRSQDEEIVRCDAAAMHPIVVRFKVTACSAYIDERVPSYPQLLQQAWILRPATPRRAAGFVPSRELPLKEFHALDLEDLLHDADD